MTTTATRATTLQAAGRRSAQRVAAPTRQPRRRSVRGWLGARLLGALSAVFRRLPDGPLHRLADAIGRLIYRAQPARRRLVRENLRRVVAYLAARGQGGQRVAAAASDERALEAMVRDAFGHYVRGYLEGAILPRYASEEKLARVVPDDSTAVDRTFGPAASKADGGLGNGRPLIILGLHFGALEIPALWATNRLGTRITAPMETISDPDLQSYFERSRGATGLNVVPAKGAATHLRASLARREAVALVADRPVAGSGTPVELFGAPARLPIGAAVLAMETDAPTWLVATRRVGWGDYRARIEQVEMPPEGTRRERLSGFLNNEARAYERAIAEAPEQWWTMFFPIWDDLRP